jgi:LuxR family transcriptional regulator, maltose regulon positive regulatory protein
LELRVDATASTRGTVTARRSQVVLRAKLHEPRLRPEWVLRKHVLRGVEMAPPAGVVLITAPAGYGKSTVLAQWKSRDRRPFAWVSLDSSDNDVVRFWTYVVEAFQQVVPTLGGSDLIGRIHRPSVVRDSVVPRILNQLAESPEDVVLVLDDYHLISNPACHELVMLMIENLPPTVQVAISSRVEPPLGFARLRVDRKLLDLRVDDLRFDLSETIQLLRRILGRIVPRRHAQMLLDRTEGWPAAIYLAAVSLKSGEDIPTLLKRFTGESRVIADFLSDEVLRRLPIEQRQFLVRTSILERMTAPLAQEVSGLGRSTGFLRELERSNLFVVPLDDRREWFRYHQLFRQMLLGELQRSEPTLIANLHRRASAWFDDHGYVGRAVHHAIQGRDVASARDLIWVNLLAYVNAGRIETVESWLSALGRATIASDPVLCLTAGWIAGLTGRMDRVDEWLEAAERRNLEGPLADGTSSLQSGIALLRAFYGRIGVSEALGLARDFVATDSARSGEWRAMAFFVVGFLLHVQGSLTEAQHWLEKARKESRFGQPLLEACALSDLSMVASDEGDGPRARALVEEAEATSERSSLFDLPQSSFVQTARGRVLADEGDLQGAASALERALYLRDSKFQMNPWPTMQTLIALAPIRFSLGDHERARALVQRATAILDFQPDAGVFGSQVKRLERSLGQPSQRPALFGETLTDRELAVMRLLPTTLTHREIGRSLFISLNTVKSHIRSIYMKLTVSSRDEAVIKAQELGLL